MSLADAFHGRNVLVTGGLGFLGSNLVIRLARYGANVTILDSLVPQFGGSFFNISSVRGQVAVNISDMRDANSLDILVQGKDYIFNLAGQVSHGDSMRDPQLDLGVNCISTMNLVEASVLKSQKTTVVFSMEMPAEQLILRMLSSIGRIDQTRVRTGKLEEEDWPRLSSAVSQLKDKPLLIDDTTEVLEVDEGHRLLLKARGWPAGEAHVEISLEPSGATTTVTITEDATSGPGVLVPKPLRDAQLHWRNVEALRRLAFVVEGRTQ